MIDKVANDLRCYTEAATGLAGVAIGVPSRSGHFLLLFDPKGAGGQFEAVGIDDRKADGFYIRLRDGAISEVPKISRGGSCERSSFVTAPCRLVAYSHRFGVKELYDVFRAALTTYTRGSIGEEVQAVDASVRRILLDFTSIVIEESTPQERESMTGYEGMMNLIAIDFDLNYTHENCGKTVKPLC